VKFTKHPIVKISPLISRYSASKFLILKRFDRHNKISFYHSLSDISVAYVKLECKAKNCVEIAPHAPT